MKQLATSVIALSLFATLGCGSGAGNLGVGEPCSSSTECAAGLLCDFGMTPSTCQSQGTPVPDASLIDASTIDSTTIDAGNQISDAPLPDAPLPDAPLPDAEQPDANTMG